MMSEFREPFDNQYCNSLSSFADVTSTEWVSLKVQNEYYYDFTIHNSVVKKPQTLTDIPTFKIKTSAIVLVKSPHVPNAANIQACLNDKWIENYDIEFCTMQKNFFFVTGGAAAMANIARILVSRSACEYGTTWLARYINLLDNITKAVVAKYEMSTALARVHTDFDNLIIIVGAATFRSKQFVASRVPFAPSYWYSIWDSLLCIWEIQQIFQQCLIHNCAKQKFISNGVILVSFATPRTYIRAPTPFLGIEAINDAFKPLYDVTMLFKALIIQKFT